MSEKRCYTVQELQEILGVSRPTIYNLLKKKEFRWIQLDGGKYRISKKSFDDCQELISRITAESHYQRIPSQKKTWMTVPEMGNGFRKILFRNGMPVSPGIEPKKTGKKMPLLKKQRLQCRRWPDFWA